VSTGPSSLAFDLTRNRDVLSQALEKMSGASLKPSQVIAAPDNDSSEVRYRAHLTFDTTYDLMKMLAGVSNTRKAIIYISDGYYFDVWHGAPASATNPFSSSAKTFSLERLRDEVGELVAQTKRSNVTIYGIDPRALSGAPTPDPVLDEVTWQKYWTTTRNSLQVIAEESGGFVIEDDLESGLKRIATAIQQ
jgi:hypothetical protein